MKRVLVTGAGGYIGSVLVPLLLARHYRVRAIDRFFFGQELLPAHRDLELIRDDTRHLRLSHFEDVDAVIDLAAVSNDPSGELFQTATRLINHRARVRAAALAKKAAVSRYILPSSCSIYGFQANGEIADETSSVNPLTTYAHANKRAEDGVLPLADETFTVAVLRQATVYGLSPRMRFDLAINGMTYGAWTTGKLPLMRDGNQWRPMVHVRDAALAQIFMLEADPATINGQIFNVGSDENNYRLKDVAEIVSRIVPQAVTIEWYGDPDHRSYRVSFERLQSLGWRAERNAADGVREISAALEDGDLRRTKRTLTLDWYKEINQHEETYGALSMYGGMLDIAGWEAPVPEPQPRQTAQDGR